jgi:hypothetical protein
MWYDYYNNGRLKEITNYKIFTRKNSANSISVFGMKETLSELDGKYQAFSQTHSCSLQTDCILKN